MRNSNQISFLVVGDLHGRIPNIVDTDFDAIICPGDICGDDLRKYLNTPISEKKLDELEQISLKKGRKVLEYLNSFNKPVFFVPGNWDFQPRVDGNFNPEDEGKFDSILRGLKNLVNVEDTCISFNGISIIGHGSTSAPENFTQEDLFLAQILEDEEEIERVLFFNGVYDTLSNFFKQTNQPVFFISHNVPLNTNLDIIDAPGSELHKKHYGSKIARHLIDEFSPLLCVGGHIHEGRGKEIVNSTMCINAGFGERVMTKIIVDTTQKKILQVKML